MPPRERMLAAYEGRKPDCVPASAPYLFLSDADHWAETTSLPMWGMGSVLAPKSRYEWHLAITLGEGKEPYGMSPSGQFIC